MTLAYPQWALVDAPSLDANVLVDFNPHGYKASGFSLGAPDFLGDADSISPELGFRSISGAVIIEGSEAELGAWMVEAQRALMRPRAFMLWRPTPSSPPRWAHTYQSASGPLSWDLHTFRDSDENRIVLPLTITADPGLLGEQEAFELTIGNDPSTGGCFAALPEIKGDLPAPLRLQLQIPAYPASGLTGQSIGVTTATALDLPALTFDVTNTAGPTPDADAVTGNYYETTTSVDDEFTTLADLSLSSLAAGSRRALIRMRSDGLGTPSKWEFRIASYPYSGSSEANGGSAVVTADRSTRFAWLDLGLFEIPDTGGLDEHTTNFQIEIRRLSGTSELRFDDVVVLVPMNDPSSWMHVLGPGYFGATDERLYVDSESTRTAQHLESTTWLYNGSGQVSGYFPMAHPGESGGLVYFRQVAPTIGYGGDDVDSDPVTVTVSYFPRFLGLPS